MKRSTFRTIPALLFAVIFTTSFAAGTDIQKTFTWNYDINKDATVNMDNYDCNLVIHTWDKSETEFRLIIEAETRSDEDAATLDRDLQNLVFANSPSSVSFSSRFWENRTTIMNRTTMKLKSGKTITLSSFGMSGELWIPAGCRFELFSKYSQINMEDFAGPLTMDLYNDNFYGGTMSSGTEINDKYSTLEFRDMKDLRASLYNSKLSAGNAGDLTMESKYSRVNVASCKKLSVNSYNDKYEAPQTGYIKFSGKYSDLTTGSSDNVTLDMYNGTVIMKEVKDVEINSKYTEYQFTAAGRCTILSSYNDKLAAGRLTSLSINASKYGIFRIDNLTESLEDKDSYNDKFTVSETGKEFRGIDLNGKYIDAEITLLKSISYRFKANIKYAKLDIDEPSLKPIVKIIDGSEVKWDAVKGTESEGMPVINLNGYDVKLKISEI